MHKITFLSGSGEMYLAVTLLERGFDLKRHGNEGPEFYAVVENNVYGLKLLLPDQVVVQTKFLRCSMMANFMNFRQKGLYCDLRTLLMKNGGVTVMP